MFKKLLLLLILTLALAAPAGEKRIIGSKAGGNQTLMRVDIVTKIIEYTTNGTDWFQPLLAEATTSSAGLMSASDKSKLDGLGSGSSGVSAFSALSDTAVVSPSDGQQLVYKDTAEAPASGLLINFPLTSSTPNTSQSVTNSGVTFAYDTEADRNVGVFNGSSYLSFAEASMPTGNPEITIFVYVKIGSGMGTADGVIFGYGKNNSTENCVSGLLIATSYFGFHNHMGGGTAFIASHVFEAERWYAVCATRNGTAAKLYVDGAEIASGTYDTTNLTQNDGCNVGRYAFQDAAYFNGKVSKLLVYNRVLSDSEIVGLSAGVKNEMKIVNIDPVISINAQTASYTLVIKDKNKLVTVSNASANTLTIPMNSSVAFPVGTWIDVSNIGAGTCTVTAESGVTLNGTDGGTKDLAQWAGTRLYKIAENTWITR